MQWRLRATWGQRAGGMQWRLRATWGQRAGGMQWRRAGGVQWRRAVAATVVAFRQAEWGTHARAWPWVAVPHTKPCVAEGQTALHPCRHVPGPPGKASRTPTSFGTQSQSTLAGIGHIPNHLGLFPLTLAGMTHSHAT
eukprot:365041-Chlamydomonas_euryale.AAC.2